MLSFVVLYLFRAKAEKNVEIALSSQFASKLLEGYSNGNVSVYWTQNKVYIFTSFLLQSISTYRF